MMAANSPLTPQRRSLRRRLNRCPDPTTLTASPFDRRSSAFSRLLRCDRQLEPVDVTVRPIGMIARPAVVAAVLGVGMLASACVDAHSTRALADGTAGAASPCPSAFALSLVSDRGGEATPVAAADWFAKHGGVSVPVGGWHETTRSNRVAMVASSGSTLHVVEGSDHKWQVDSGHNCG
jgi:hypothetical protein